MRTCVLSWCLVAFAGAQTPPASTPRVGGAIPGGGPVILDGGVTVPRVIEKPQPDYPAELRDIKGEVWLSVLISDKGFPTDIKVVRKLDPRLDAAAIDALKKWKFKPGMKDGVAVPVKVTISIPFPTL